MSAHTPPAPNPSQPNNASNSLDWNNAIVLDLETQKSFEEVGGFQSGHEKLGVSFCGVYSFKANKYVGFWENELPVLEKILITERPTVIGFNSKSFDFPVMQPYMSQIQLSTLPHLDILEEVVKALKFRLKLDTIATAVLGEGKSGHGLDAIRWFREGALDKLSKYCIDDVRVTKEVFEYGQNHGKLWYQQGGQLQPIPVHWGTAPFIPDQITQAAAQHTQIKVSFISLTPEGVKTIEEHLIDPRSIQGSNLIAYSHTTQKEISIPIHRIWSISSTGQKSAHQASLL